MPMYPFNLSIYSQPQVIDAAVYRRMPIRFQLKLPARPARVKILRVLLQGNMMF